MCARGLRQRRPRAAGGHSVATGRPDRVGRGVAAVDTARIGRARQRPEGWLTYGGTYDEQRHSLLDEIDTSTVSELGVAWTYPLRTARGVEATPLVVDGVMYVTSAWSVVHALDARTGELLWSRVTVDQSRPYTIAGAPRVVDGKVLIGNGGAESGVRGCVSAYDADGGDLVWRFYTVPSPDKSPDGAASDPALAELANATWGDDGAWRTDGGGGTVWDSIVYDEVNDHIAFGVGNGSPWSQAHRDPSGGDNLFLSSIAAVDADTDAYEWHFQTTPADTWDYTATQSIVLADLPLGEDGADRCSRRHLKS